MSPRNRTLLLLGVGVLVLLVLLWPRGSEPDRTTTGDSLRVTRPEFVARVETVTVAAAGALAASDRAARRARAAEARSDSLKGVADSLASEARTTDSSATAWQAAYDARTAEVGEVRVALGEMTVSRDSAVVAARGWERGMVLERDRRVALEGFVARLEKDIAGMERKCRVGFIPCPSRKQAAVVGFGLGVALTLVR